jgi:hypothetical protein
LKANIDLRVFEDRSEPVDLSLQRRCCAGGEHHQREADSEERVSEVYPVLADADADADGLEQARYGVDLERCATKSSNKARSGAEAAIALVGSLESLKKSDDL